MLKKISVFVLLISAAALFFTGCSGSNDSDAVTLKVGSQNYAEVEILGELVKTIINENTPHKALHIRNLGSSMACHEATIKGDLDFHTSFTGTLFLGLFNQALTDEYRDPEKVYRYVHDNLLEEYGLYAFAPYGYNNTYAVSVPRKWAEKHNITKQSQLAPHAKDMILAVDQSWKDYPGQGYKEYVELYGFEFKETPQMDFGIMYQAIDKGEVDAINCYSTDGQLIAQDLVVLEDDKGFNPPYNGILVANNKILEEYPEVKEALTVLEGLIDTEQMQELNKQVVVDGKEPDTVAEEFLKDKGIIN
ncbi:MAG TPA: osmoprotectant ABC transporter substrate-binding protein [Firmicutes bacterium]|nr:osmoprotectant ABC transporter substrate-binding protein [Bacillota bacterium]